MATGGDAILRLACDRRSIRSTLANVVSARRCVVGRHGVMPAVALPLLGLDGQADFSDFGLDEALVIAGILGVTAAFIGVMQLADRWRARRADAKWREFADYMEFADLPQDALEMHAMQGEYKGFAVWIRKERVHGKRVWSRMSFVAGIRAAMPDGLLVTSNQVERLMGQHDMQVRDEEFDAKFTLQPDLAIAQWLMGQAHFRRTLLWVLFKEGSRADIAISSGCVAITRIDQTAIPELYAGLDAATHYAATIEQALATPPHMPFTPPH